MLVDDDDDDDDDSDEDFIPTDLTTAFNFTSDELEMIRSCIRDVNPPNWVGRPPSNLGEASHGKLKAQELPVLFTVILPLIIPEIWWKQGPTETRLLENFHHLVACTNIISSYSASDSEADRYMDLYVQYRTSKAQLFPEFPSVPNHHLAMYNGAQMKFWGPLPLLSEFPGERMNGMLGKIKTNRHLGEIDLTMLRQMCRRFLLEGILNDDIRRADKTSGSMGELALILQPKDAFRWKAPTKSLDGSEVAKILAAGKSLSSTEYDMLLKHLRTTNKLWHSWIKFPHPTGALILPPNALQPSQFKIDGHMFSCRKSHEGNSGIQFTIANSSNPATGLIESIWQIPLQGHLQTFLLIEVHKQVRNLVPFDTLPYLETAVVEAAPSKKFILIEPAQF
ncbi:hypothetical protein C8J57DRAFT_1069424 [Mycena rebaudengoi]|nr:hypothetical protein C8J57DRAFT_1069424 [Mycena rebaudengoi]